MKLKNSTYKHVPLMLKLIKNFPLLYNPTDFKVLDRKSKLEVFKRLRRINILIVEISNIIFKADIDEDIKKNL